MHVSRGVHSGQGRVRGIQHPEAALAEFLVKTWCAMLLLGLVFSGPGFEGGGCFKQGLHGNNLEGGMICLLFLVSGLPRNAKS